MFSVIKTVVGFGVGYCAGEVVRKTLISSAPVAITKGSKLVAVIGITAISSYVSTVITNNVTNYIDEVVDSVK